MCSALIFNALRHGGPGTTSGTIGVTLENKDAALVPTKGNVGIDHNSPCRTNQASAWLARLSAVSGAAPGR